MRSPVKILKNVLFWAGAFLIIFVVFKNKSFWLKIIYIFVWTAVLDLLFYFFRAPARKKPRVTREELQKDPRFNTRGKAFRAVTNHFVSNLLIFFNPFLLTQIFLQIVGVLCERMHRPVPAPDNYQQKGSYILPVSGEWFVFNGGVTPETSHSWGIPTQRFAYDLIQFGPDGRSYSGNGRALTDYLCYNAPILAPADGVVIKVRDGIRDAPFVGTFWMDCFTRDIAGNSVVIKHAEGEFSLLAHLKRGSIRVKPGDNVKQGQEIARCGHSGNSTEPHLHFQFQNGKSFYFNSGLPIKFSRFWRRDNQENTLVERDYLSKKFFVRSADTLQVKESAASMSDAA